MPLKPYDQPSMLRDIVFRYENARRSFPQTIRRLQQDSAFLSTVERLHDAGWKDWHIVQAIFNGAINWYAIQAGVDYHSPKIRDEAMKLYQELREKGEGILKPPIPVTYFTFDMMQLLLDVGVRSFLDGKGAIFRDRPYNFEKLRRFAQMRYHYLDLDVPHDPIFSTSGSNDIGSKSLNS
jgi:hypothetical protein